MININLLPPEHRRAEATPIARFIAIVAGAVVVTSALVGYGYVHYSELKGVREVREATEHEFANKKARADVSRALEAEIEAYEVRRQAITQIAGSRILQSRKLDEFLDVVYNKDDRTNYFIWLKTLSVKPARQARRGKPTSGGTFSFAGFSETTEFSRITNLREAIKADVFFQDFQSISQPVFKEHYWKDELIPNSAGKFSYDLTFKPLGWRTANKGEK